MSDSRPRGVVGGPRRVPAAGIAALALALSSGAVPVELPDIVFADGTGLPEGSGSAADGAPLYARLCAGCHGSRGEGASALELVGERASLASEYPDRGIAAFWPWAPPLWDYVRRAMPPDAPGSLSVDETYAVVARLLEMNGLIASGEVVDRASLAALRMPNREGFTDIDLPE